MATRVQLRRGTASAWTAANPVLALGEPGLETGTQKVKYGDGSSTWTALPYAAGGAALTTEQVAQLSAVSGKADAAAVEQLAATVSAKASQSALTTAVSDLSAQIAASVDPTELAAALTAALDSTDLSTTQVTQVSQAISTAVGNLPAPEVGDGTITGTKLATAVKAVVDSAVRYVGGVAVKPNGDPLPLGGTTPAPVGITPITTSPRTQVAADLGATLLPSIGGDVTVRLPGSSLSLADYPVGGATTYLRGSGILTVEPEQGTLLTPAVRDVSTLARDYGGNDYVVPYATTATGDRLFLVTSRSAALATWPGKEAWTLLTQPFDGMTSGGPGDASSYLWMLTSAVTGNLAGQTETFTAAGGGNDGRPAAFAMFSVSGLSSAPVAAYVQTNGGYDGGTSPAATAPSGAGGILDIAIAYSSEESANYTAPAGTTLMASVRAGGAGPFARLGVARSNSPVAGGATAPALTWGGGGFGGGLRLLLAPGGSGPDIVSPNNARRLVLPGTSVTALREALGRWRLIGGVEV